MKNKEYSLQLLTHKSEIFATREDAIEYFEVNFRPNSLIGEPALAFYGDQKSPKAIMAIGVADKKVFYIDTNKLSESIDDVISKNRLGRSGSCHKHYLKQSIRIKNVRPNRQNEKNAAKRP